MRWSRLRTCFAVFSTSFLFTFSFPLSALPKIPKARPETPPVLPSPYQLCPQPLKEQSLDVLLNCAEPEFWHAFSDGRTAPRKAAEALLGTVIGLAKKNSETPPEKLGRLYALRGYLRLAMGLENAQLKILLGNDTERDFERAKSLDPSNKTYDTFVDSIYIAKPAVFGQWDKAIAVATKAFDILATNPDNILSLSGTTIGFPLASGIPQKTIAAMSAWTCPEEEKAYCTQNTEHAPYARPGLSFHFAEAYARMGMRDEAKKYFEQAKASADFEKWPYRSLVDKPLADLDVYMKTWEKYGNEGQPFSAVYANQNYGCVMCHGR